MLGWLPGMSARDAAGREIGYNQFNDTRTGITDDGWNWQDQLGAILGGYTKEDVVRIGQKKLDDQLQKEVDAKYGNTGTELEGLGLKGSYGGSVTGLTQTEINKRLSSDSSRLSAIVRNQDIPNFDPSTLSPTATTAQILQAGSAQRDKNTKTAEDKVTAETQRLEARADKLQAGRDARQDALLAHQASETNRRLAHEANETNKTRLHELALQEARDNQTMQLAMMDREDRLADRRYAREDRAADRRQQSIMMLVKGLAQLGQGFSL